MNIKVNLDSVVSADLAGNKVTTVNVYKELSNVVYTRIPSGNNLGLDDFLHKMYNASGEFEFDSQYVPFLEQGTSIIYSVLSASAINKVLEDAIAIASTPSVTEVKDETIVSDTSDPVV